MSYIFDKDMLQAQLNKIERLTYTIGVDTWEIPTYCLVRNQDGIVTTLLLKQMKDRDKFDEEVKNLSKYFNAEIYREGN